MGNITLTHTFANATVADATKVNTNFTDITSVVNGSIDGTNISAGSTISAASLSVTGSVTATTSLISDTIAEKTAATGVTIDGTLIKDGGATLATPVINTSISGTAIATGAEVTTGTDNTKIVTPKAIGDAGLKIGAFTEVTSFANSWVNYGSIYATAGYRKDAFGFVHIKGFIKSGTSGTAAFTLPSGYRPALVEYFPAYTAGVYAYVNILQDGTVVPVGTNTSFSISGITFYAE